MSRLRIQRICQFCGSEFTAQKTVTKFCSLACGQRAYKVRKRNEKVQQSDRVTARIKAQPIEILKAKEFLKVREAATLLNCSVRSLYYYVGNGNIKSVNLGQRITRIKRSDIDQLFQVAKKESNTIAQETIKYSIDECYSLTEIKNRFNISGKTLYDLIKRNKIPKLKEGRQTFVPKPIIDRIFY